MADDKKKRTTRPLVFDMTSNECVWSAAGLVPYRLCDSAFDCTGCAFDRSMQKRHARGGRSWQELSRRTANAELRQCRHMVSGYISAKYCPNNFDCANCAFDQMLDEEVLTQQPPSPVLRGVEGFEVADGHYFAGTHTWARLEYARHVRVGIDDFAACLLGAADSWELPRLGQAVVVGEPLMTMHRGEHTARFGSAVEGIVVAVNPSLVSHPDWSNASPYDRGWLVLVQPTNLVRNLRKMRFGEEVDAWFETEVGRLNETIQPQTDYRLAATGGSVVRDIVGSVPGVSWDQLTSKFL